MTETERAQPEGGSDIPLPVKKVPGLCVVCRVDVTDPLAHNISDSHLAKAKAWDKAAHGTPKRKP